MEMMSVDEHDTEQNKVWYLKRNRFFVDTDTAGVERFEHLFTIVEYPRRAMIFDHGDPTRVVYFIKRGAVRIARLTEDGKEVTVAVLGPGDLFGVEALFGEGPRTTVAIAIDDVLLCTSKAEDLFSVLRTDPHLAMNVAKVLNERLGDAISTMEDLAYAKVGDRLMHLFRRLASEHGVRVVGGTRIDVRLTHADLASLIGSTRETVSLELAHLTKAGHIGHDGRAFVVPDQEAAL
jgi:CRP/FNR family cyclic AMP-dependent transcriptional regulator